MEVKLVVLLLLTVCRIYNSNAQINIPLDKNFACAKDVPGQPIQLEKLAGLWYEVARAPQADVMDCLNISVPQMADNVLQLDLEYISKAGRKRGPVRETVSFPWNTATQNGTFVLTYYGKQTIHVTYKIMQANSFITVLCGFASASPIPLFKVLSRQRKVHEGMKNRLNAKAGKYIIWPKQDHASCNVAVHPVARFFTILTLFCVSIKLILN